MIVAWTGMRGVVSLAAALALPSKIKDATQCKVFIIFFTFVVILGLFAGVAGVEPAVPTVARLKVTDSGETELERSSARLKANQAALARLGVESDGHFAADLLQRLRVE